jgi:hypothetical protein
VLEAVGAVLPYAVGAAGSPLLFTIEVIILAGGVQPKLRAWIYVAGAACVAVVVIALVALVFQGASPSDSGPSPFARGVEVTAGLALAALAVRAFLPRHPGESSHPGRLHEMMLKGRGRTFFVIGMIMMATNASSIVIMIPGIHAVEAARPGLVPALVALSVLLVFVMIPALVPVGIVTVMGARSDALLARLNHFVGKHSRTITGLICGAIAAYLIVSALR